MTPFELPKSVQDRRTSRRAVQHLGARGIVLLRFDQLATPDRVVFGRTIEEVFYTPFARNLRHVHCRPAYINPMAQDQDA